MKNFYSLIMFLVAIFISTLNLHAQNYNYFAGLNAGSGNTGSWCTAVGEGSLSDANKGNYNTGFGYASLVWNTTGTRNTGIGYRALDYNKTGHDNTGSGFQALYNTKGSFNTANGANALYTNTNGNYNTAIGYSALYYDSASDNTATGYQSLYYNRIGSGNSATGYASLYSNNADDNTADGFSSLYSNGSGFGNAASGYKSMYLNLSGNYNTANGHGALYNNLSGGYNTASGHDALYTNTTGNYNTALGYSADVSSTNLTNATAIGYNAMVTASNQVMLGNTSVTSVKAAGSFVIYSDGRFKKNIKENVPGLAFINALKPVTYNYDINGMNEKIGINKIKNNTNNGTDKTEQDAINTKEKKIYTGFVAQDVEAAANKLNYDFSGVYKPQNDNDLYGLSYADFVVPLVKAVQELSKQNDSLKNEISAQQKINIDLQNQINDLKAMITSNHSSAVRQQSTFISSASLQQNVPNPFNNTTTINYVLPQTYSSAKIIITDKNGSTIKTININGSTNGSVKIDASTLISGAYQYSLYVNNKLIDTKQMILSK